MATYTTNYNLEKPAQTDIYNVDVFNANADKIDAALTDKAETTMLAPVETTNHASRAYAVGEYFVFNGYLCRATAAIASGGTIAIGTNCASTAAGTELTAIKESLSNTASIAVAIASGGSATYTLTSGATRHILVTGHANKTELCGLYLLVNAVAMPIVDAPSVTVTMSSNTSVTIANNYSASLNGVILC